MGIKTSSPKRREVQSRCAFHRGSEIPPAAEEGTHSDGEAAAVFGGKVGRTRCAASQNSLW